MFRPMTYKKFQSTFVFIFMFNNPKLFLELSKAEIRLLWTSILREWNTVH